MTDIPRDHPRYQSLMVRELLVKGVGDGIVSMQGLIAQGRGEAFDYLIGEVTTPSAASAEGVAVALMLLAENPVISVNGNAAALTAPGLVRLAKVVGAGIEVNLFHRTEERVRRIADLLRSCGCERLYGERPDRLIPGLSHDRAKASSEGVWTADVVLVPLEDGDRCEALVRMGKKVIVVDLNPVSRSAKAATVTIVDNIVRAVPRMIDVAGEMRGLQDAELLEIVGGFRNEDVLVSALGSMVETVGKLRG
ncbi:MAG TPA: 4-phosphopantoate--beta-alanine ligase [Methanocella sp.]|nr:4-phosphopantoate--beta-alanine ligase [Methanocella sp.]